MSEFEHLLITTHAGISTLKLNRPAQHNAFNAQTISELTEAINFLQNSTETEVLVLLGNQNTFSAGGDLEWMKASVDFSTEQNQADANKLASLLELLFNFNKPTIAVVQGAAIGGGFGLACCCDLIVATPAAYFQLSELRLGLAPAIIAPYVIRAIGERATLAYALTADRISAEQALTLGMVYKIFSEAELKEGLTEICAKILTAGPEARKQTKSLLRKIPNLSEQNAIKELTVKTIADLRTSAEGQAGIKSFLNKQTAPWIKSSS